MATVLQQVLDRLDALLKAHVPSGCNVYRERVDAVSREEAPAVNVRPLDGPVEPFSGETDLHTDLVELDIYVREEPGAVAADAIHAAVHAYLVDDAQLRALCESRRLVEKAFERTEGDGTVTHKRCRYRFTYLIPSNTL